MARHTSQFLDEAVISRTQKDQEASQATPIINFENMTPAERMVYLCDKFRVDGYLDLIIHNQNQGNPEIFYYICVFWIKISYVIMVSIYNLSLSGLFHDKLHSEYVLV